MQGLFDKARQSGAEEGTAADLRPQVPLPAKLCCLLLCNGCQQCTCALSASFKWCAATENIDGKRHDWVGVLLSCCSALHRAAPARSAAPRALSAVPARLQPRRRPLRTPSRRPRSRWCTPSPSTRTASSPWTMVSVGEHLCLGAAVADREVLGVLVCIGDGEVC